MIFTFKLNVSFFSATSQRTNKNIEYHRRHWSIIACYYTEELNMFYECPNANFIKINCCLWCKPRQWFSILSRNDKVSFVISINSSIQNLPRIQPSIMFLNYSSWFLYFGFPEPRDFRESIDLSTVRPSPTFSNDFSSVDSRPIVTIFHIYPSGIKRTNVCSNGFIYVKNLLKN